MNHKFNFNFNSTVFFYDCQFLVVPSKWSFRTDLLLNRIVLFSGEIWCTNWTSMNLRNAILVLEQYAITKYTELSINIGRFILQPKQLRLSNIANWLVHKSDLVCVRVCLCVWKRFIIYLCAKYKSICNLFKFLRFPPNL